MWDCLRNLKTTELAMREHLNGLEREWVIGRLVCQGGVHGALYHDDDPHRLIVEYDADLLSPSDLLDLLYACGLRVEPARVRRSRMHDGPSGDSRAGLVVADSREVLPLSPG